MQSFPDFVSKLQIKTSKLKILHKLALICNFILFNLGGGKRDRTDDPLLAKQVLYQLSYAPSIPFYVH